MFNVGGPEVLVILLVALIVLGPQQLPKAVRSVGNVMAELRRMSSGFQDEIRNALDGPIEAEARSEGSKLARRPEDADITETVARRPAAGHSPDGEIVSAAGELAGPNAANGGANGTVGTTSPPDGEAVAGSGATAMTNSPAPPHEDDSTGSRVPSDRATG